MVFLALEFYLGKYAWAKQLEKNSSNFSETIQHASQEHATEYSPVWNNIWEAAIDDI